MLVQELLEDFSIPDQEFESFFNFYNDKYQEYGNEVYDDLRVRLTHLKYFLENNWWNNRLYFLWKYYENYQQIIDLGFSIPYLPLRLKSLDKLDAIPRLLYVDKNDTSRKVANNLLKRLDVTAQFVVGDLEDDLTWQQIQKNTKKTEKKLFCIFETIEHLNDPAIFWKFLSKYYNRNDIVLSLPIGDKVPSHHLSFSFKQEVSSYLDQYLEIKESKIFSGKEYGSSYSIYTAFGSIR